MGILEILRFVFLYLTAGYILGKITYHEYKNETPTKKLGPLSKFKRLLLFPASYHNWNARSLLEDLDGLPPVSAVALLKENSYKMSMFLWPLKLIPTVISVVEMLFFLSWSVFDGVCLIPHFIEKEVTRLKRTKIKLLSSPIDLLSQINEMEIFLENLQRRKKFLGDENGCFNRRILELEENLAEWKTAPSPERPDQTAGIIDGLAREITVCRERSGKLERAHDVLIQKEQELKSTIKTLTRCKKTMELKVNITDSSGSKLIKEDSVATLAGASVSSANSLMAECKELVTENH